MYNYELTDSVSVEILRAIWKIDVAENNLFCKLSSEFENYVIFIQNCNDKKIDKKAYLIMNYIFNNCNYFITNKVLKIIIKKKILVEYLNETSIKQDRYFKSCEILTKYNISIVNKNTKKPEVISPIIEKIEKIQNGIEITMGKWFILFLTELKKNGIHNKFKNGNIDYSLFLSGRTDRPKCIYSLKTIVYLARLNENKSFRNREYNIKKYIPELLLLNNKTRIIEMVERMNKALLPTNIQIKIDNKLTLEELKTKGIFQIEYAKGVS